MSLVLFVYLFVFEGNMYIYIDVLIWQGLKLILAVTKWEENCIEGADFEICIFFLPSAYIFQILTVNTGIKEMRAIQSKYIYLYLYRNKSTHIYIDKISSKNEAMKFHSRANNPRSREQQQQKKNTTRIIREQHPN